MICLFVLLSAISASVQHRHLLLRVTAGTSTDQYIILCCWLRWFSESRAWNDYDEWVVILYISTYTYGRVFVYVHVCMNEMKCNVLASELESDWIENKHRHLDYYCHHVMLSGYHAFLDYNEFMSLFFSSLLCLCRFGFFYRLAMEGKAVDCVRERITFQDDAVFGV